MVAHDLPLSRATTSRDALARLEEWDELIADPQVRIVTVYQGRVLAGADEPQLHLDTKLKAGVLAFYLGKDSEHRFIAQVASDQPQGQLLSVQEVGWQLSVRDAGLATTALAMAAWHERNPYCSQCGAETTVAEAGWVRRCTAEGTLHFPRTDPAVIVAVVNDADELMLARNAAWPEFRYSLSAGFVEPGESFEAAAAREVLEEVGLEISHPQYVASQPWPFPASLMVGYTARSIGTTLIPDGAEIADARWVSRTQLPELIARGEVVLPRRTSISRMLIRQWYGQELPEAAAF